MKISDSGHLGEEIVAGLKAKLLPRIAQWSLRTRNALPESPLPQSGYRDLYFDDSERGYHWEHPRSNSAERISAYLALSRALADDACREAAVGYADAMVSPLTTRYTAVCFGSSSRHSGGSGAPTIVVVTGFPSLISFEKLSPGITGFPRKAGSLSSLGRFGCGAGALELCAETEAVSPVSDSELLHPPPERAVTASSPASGTPVLSASRIAF